jgi:hypothetical protein
MAIPSICALLLGSFVIIPQFLVCVGNKISRFDVILYRMLNKNIIMLTNETVDPIDGIIFHVV